MTYGHCVLPILLSAVKMLLFSKIRPAAQKVSGRTIYRQHWSVIWGQFHERINLKSHLALILEAQVQIQDLQATQSFSISSGKCPNSADASVSDDAAHQAPQFLLHVTWTPLLRSVLATHRCQKSHCPFFRRLPSPLHSPFQDTERHFTWNDRRLQGWESLYGPCAAWLWSSGQSSQTEVKKWGLQFLLWLMFMHSFNNCFLYKGLWLNSLNTLLEHRRDGPDFESSGLRMTSGNKAFRWAHQGMQLQPPDTARGTAHFSWPPC